MIAKGQPDARSAAGGSLLSTTLGYGLLVAATVAGFLLVRGYGENLVAPPAPTGAAAVAPATGEPAALRQVLIALAAVIIVGQVLGRLCAYVGQPPVIGEVFAGILLGPSLIGPALSAYVLPPAMASTLEVIAQLGVILYMFTVGLELNAGVLRHRAHTTVAISHTSILVPFLLGSMLALLLYPRLATADVSFTSFALFLGVAMSITAFPVLARILTDRGLARTELGIVALGCAATDDVTAWCLLALVVGIARSHAGEGLQVMALTVGYIALMFLVARPVVRRLARRWNDAELPRGAVALVFIALLLSALATQAIGIHAIFGAFLLGAVVPHDSALARAFIHQLQHVATILLLPAFFALTGMRTRIDLVSGAESWLLCGFIILVATVGKFGGTFVAARLTGHGWRDAAALGTLMNTRGLMELVVLNIGLEMRVISPTLFSMLVLMALATTLATAPVLGWLRVEGTTSGLSGK